MPDSWKCPNCKAELRCSCSSMECDFDYDITAHVRLDLTKAIENALSWMDSKAIINVTHRTINAKKEPCCDGCANNNG